MNIMLNAQVVNRRCASKIGLDDVLGVLNLCWQWVQVVLSIKIKVNSVIAQRDHISLATRGFVALRVWWTHVGWEFADDVVDCHFVLDHLCVTHRRGDIGETVMTESVRCNLVTFGNHTLEQSGIWGGDIDLALAVVVASNEKGGFEAVRLQQI